MNIPEINKKLEELNKLIVVRPTIKDDTRQTVFNCYQDYLKTAVTDCKRYMLEIQDIFDREKKCVTTEKS